MITRYYRTGEAKERKESTKEKKENTTTTPARERGVDEAVVFAAGEILGMTRKQCEEWLKYQRDVTDWTFQNGNPVTPKNFRRSLRMWREIDWLEMQKREERKAELMARRELYAKKVAREGAVSPFRKRQDEIDKLRAEGEARQKAAEHAKLQKALNAPDAWELCAEQCGNYDAEKVCCKAGCKIPPQLRPWPMPPKECKDYR